MRNSLYRSGYAVALLSFRLQTRLAGFLGMTRRYTMICDYGMCRFRLSATVAILQPRPMLVVLFALLLALSAQSRAGGPAEGTPAPALRAKLIGGGNFDLASARGKVVVLNFWASWCEPCMQEMPALDAFYRAHQGAGLEVLGISVDSASDLAKVREAAGKVSFPTALIADADTSGYGRIWRIPLTFVIDRRGVLRFSGWKFADKLDYAQLDRFVAPLLRESNPGSGMLTQRSGQ
jgi:cytochrome c biogenesis protein CcmG/thiol:disulfide interchange protein DsbE